jgi:hypothetical protein
MSDEEIVRALARFNDNSLWEIDLESRDSLEPVLAKLSEEQWTELLLILQKFWAHRSAAQINRYLLTCPPRTFAAAIAEMLKEDQP